MVQLKSSWPLLICFNLSAAHNINKSLKLHPPAKASQSKRSFQNFPKVATFATSLDSNLKNTIFVRGGEENGKEASVADVDDILSPKINESIESNMPNVYDETINENKIIANGETSDEQTSTSRTISETGPFIGTSKERFQQVGKKVGLQKLKSNIEQLKDQTSDVNKRIMTDHLDFSSSVGKLKSYLQKTTELGKRSSDSFFNIFSPVLSAIIPYFSKKSEQPLTNFAVFTLALLGSSLGFYSFLYFISVGYGLGVALPAVFALYSYNNFSNNPIPMLTNIHTACVIAWGLRLALFLLHREYINWKEWHGKLKEVDQRSKITSKFSIWMSCTFFYTSLVMPCLYRLRQANSQFKASNTQDKLPSSWDISYFLPDHLKSPHWGTFGIIGIALQIFGFIMECIADYQKASFKAITVTTGNRITSSNRNKWCNIGLWKYFTHPNYLGESVFWIGTYMASAGAMNQVPQYIVGVFGLLATFVILLGATEQLDQKQWNQYKRNPDFVQYRENIGFMGPKIFKNFQSKAANKSRVAANGVGRTTR